MESYSLYEVNEYIKRVIALNFEDAVWIECEINQINEKRGNYYLQLIEKEEEKDVIKAQASAAIWYRNAMFIKKKLGKLFDSILQGGVKVKLKCSISFSERYGMNYVIEDVDVNYTIGQMEIQRQKVIERLKEEKLLNLNHQKNLPSVLQRIAVVSSEKAAGFADFMEHLNHNNYDYAFEIALFDSAMQGQNMETEITDSIREINDSYKEYDCVVVIRGGGSKLDLSGFDNFNIAAHIAKCKLPVITGIGHEIDQTVSDLTANLSLKTPTAVAGYLVEQNLHYETTIIELAQQINGHIQNIFDEDSLRLDNIQERLYYNIKDRFSSEHISLQSIERLTQSAIQQKFQIHKSKLDAVNGILKVVHPDNILKRGFSYIMNDKDQHITNKKSAMKESELVIHFKDGKLKVKA